MKEIKEIVFDMDGTIADLYGVKGWLSRLRREDPTPYSQAEPLWDMAILVEILAELQEQGIKIRVVSWLGMESSEEYKEQVREAKKNWLAEYEFPFDYCNMVAYGTKKQNCIKNKTPISNEYILIDDSQEVRDSWNIGRTVDPTTENIIDFLQGLLE